MINRLLAAFAAVAFLALCGSASAQEEIIGGGVYRPSAHMVQPIMAVINLPISGTSTEFGGVEGYWASGFGATAVRAVPLPANGTVSGLYTNLTASQIGASVVDHINTADGTLGCTYPNPASPPAVNCSDNHSDPVSAGDLFEWHWPAPGAWTQPTAGTAPQQISFLFTPTDGQTGAFISGPISIPGNVASQYIGFGAGPTNATVAVESQVEVVMNEPVTLTSLYVIPNATTHATNDQIFTVCVNGNTACLANPSAGMFCQLGSNTTTGCCVNTTGAGHIGGGSGPTCGTVSSISLNKGDTISILISCASAGCNTILPGVSVGYIPSVPGHAMLVAQVDSNGVTGANTFFQNLYDVQFLSPSGTQVSYGLTPFLNGKTITFSNMLTCATAGPTTGNSRTVSPQEVNAPGTPPATIGGGTVATYTSTNVACPGGNAALIASAQSTAGTTWTAGSGYSVDYLYSASGSSIGTVQYKTSITAVIQ